MLSAGQSNGPDLTVYNHRSLADLTSSLLLGTCLVLYCLSFLKLQLRVSCYRALTNLLGTHIPAHTHSAQPSNFLLRKMNTHPRSSNAASARPPLPGRNANIYFSTRHETHYAFTNVSTHPIRYQGNLYLTAEHLYQALKVRIFRATSNFWADSPLVSSTPARHCGPRHELQQP